MTERSAHDKLRDRIAEDYRQKGYQVFTEKTIGNRRVDIYAENDQEVLIIEVVDTHYPCLLDGKSINQIKFQIISQHRRSTNWGEWKRRVLGSSMVGRRFQITIPKTVRDVFDFREGDLVLFVEEDGKLTLTKSVIE